MVIKFVGLASNIIHLNNEIFVVNNLRAGQDQLNIARGFESIRIHSMISIVHTYVIRLLQYILFWSIEFLLFYKIFLDMTIEIVL